MTSHSFNQSFLSITLTQGSTDSLCKGSIEKNFHIEEQQIADELNPGERARILRKLDWHLLPFVSLLYMLSFLWVCQTPTFSSVASYFMLPSGIGPMLVSNRLCSIILYIHPHYYWQETQKSLACLKTCTWSASDTTLLRPSFLCVICHAHSTQYPCAFPRYCIALPRSLRMSDVKNNMFYSQCLGRNIALKLFRPSRWSTFTSTLFSSPPDI